MPSTNLPDPAGADTKWIKLASIHTDERVNRPLNRVKVDRIRENFDPSLLGVIVVAADGKGGHVPLDGQHRAAAARELWLDDDTQLIEAKVYTGLKTPQMAAMFVGLNDGNKPHPIEIFLKRATGLDPVATAISKIVHAHGLRVAAPAKDGHVVAVSALEKIYLGFGANGAAPDLLDRTLEYVVNAWGRTRDSVRTEVLLGLALVLARDGALIDKPSLIHKLSLFHGGAAGISADAKQLRGIRGGTLHNNVADVIVGIYNRGRRTRKLPDWRAA